MSSTIRKVCSKCGRSKILDEFFCYKNGERDDLCKDCLLEHVTTATQTRSCGSLSATTFRT